MTIKDMNWVMLEEISKEQLYRLIILMEAAGMTVGSSVLTTRELQGIVYLRHVDLVLPAYHIPQLDMLSMTLKELQDKLVHYIKTNPHD